MSRDALLAVRALVQDEFRLRSRRLSSLVCLLVMVALCWLLVADPATGRALMVMGKQRLAYQSQTLAFGTALIAGMLMGLAGFYLVRGRTQLDLRSGVAAVLAATPVSNSALLLARWLGALLYLATLMLGLLLTVCVLHLMRGAGPLEPLVYLTTYALVLGPVLMFTASMAVLADAWPPLMGKRGDLLFFCLWAAQFAALPIVMSAEHREITTWLVFDIAGLPTHLLRMSELLQVRQFSLGGSGFDSSLAPVQLQGSFWTLQLLALRAGSALLALLPLGLAGWLFHRYSPDKVRASPGQQKAWLAWVQRLLQPLGRGANRLLPWCARWPGLAGQVAAEVLVSLSASPLALLLGLGVMVAGVASPTASLGSVLCAAATLWGILISDVSARDHQVGMLALTSAAPGGPRARFLRQCLASLALGLILCLPVLLRWGVGAPLLAAALLSGLVFLSALASFLGQSTGSGRAYLSLFLFGLYLSVQTPQLAWFDPLGFNGSATAVTVGSYLAMGLGLLALGQILNLRRHA
ncbi:hypothetical protein LNV09_02130 [Paucibacter sp. B2R-40]|uniref:hypothetical protein n=1 Tax=Paucibacter sp. B2R-40 TaxID=2893554 RepID=UPI0021E36A5A|nr:hypothetical protein [Paucibacter sp. B2R-40]MCV2352954.1 hypothetical protein [Paucibacter sp. B2R-40]